MKNMLTVINLLILFAVTAIFSTPPKQDLKKANTLAKQVSIVPKATRSSFNIKMANPNNIIDKDILEFIEESADARLMDLEEGKVASRRSTTKGVKEYGNLMIEDQSKMLEDLKKLALRKKLTLPASLSEEKADGLEDLKKEHGKSFDKKFIKMMILDHKRDMRKFEKATKSRDADIQIYATKYLPVVKSHLDKIRSLKKNID